MLNVLIIGCGNIAGGFDMAMQPLQKPCTHAGAYYPDSRYALKACIEPDDKVRQRFAGHWGVEHACGSFNELLQLPISIDVVSICSPTAHHKHDVINALSLAPKLIFCEKPVTSSADETWHLIELCREANTLLAVNHTRRWDPDVVQLKTLIKDKHYGELRSVVACYNKGLLNNGSHLIDLLHYLLGDLKVVAVGPRIFDYSEQDPSVTALLYSSGSVPVHVVTGHASDFALFEVQFVFSKGILTMREGGLSWSLRKTTNSDRFAGYRILDNDELNDGAYSSAMTCAVDEIFRAIVHGGSLSSDGVSAYQAQAMCEKIDEFSSN